MTLKPLRQTESKRTSHEMSSLLDKNPWWEYRRDKYEQPNGEEGSYYYIHTHGAVIAAAREPDGRFILVRQFRYLWQRVSLEFVGGGITLGKTAEETATDELREEAGLVAKQLIKLGVINPMKGATDEECHLFLATDVVMKEADPEASEEFEIARMTLTQIGEAILSGEMWDAASIAAYTMIMLRWPSI